VEPSEEKSLFERVGGLVAVRRLVDTFYDLMDQRPEVHTLRALHPPDLTGSRDKLYAFLVGWMGGPPLYVEQHGHPRLRARHLPFSIGVQERDEWLACMRDAAEMTLPLEQDPAARTFLLGALSRLADHMRNRPG
jgi:hemoglobin